MDSLSLFLVHSGSIGGDVASQDQGPFAEWFESFRQAGNQGTLHPFLGESKSVKTKPDRHYGAKLQLLKS